MKKYADNKKQDDIRLAMEEDCEKEISEVRATTERAIKHEQNRNHVLKCHNDQMSRNTKR